MTFSIEDNIIWIVIAGIGVVAILVLLARAASSARVVGGGAGKAVLAEVSRPVEHSQPVDVGSELQLSHAVLLEGDREVREMAASGRKLEAIHQVRQLTGIGLQEATDYVDRLPGAPPLASLAPSVVALDPDIEAQIRTLMRDGRKMEAIALCREQTELDLRHAKELVESLERQSSSRPP